MPVHALLFVLSIGLLVGAFRRAARHCIINSENKFNLNTEEDVTSNRRDASIFIHLTKRPITLESNCIFQ